MQFSFVDENSDVLNLSTGTMVTAEFAVLADADAELRLEMDLQTADGTVVVDLTEYATVIYEGEPVCTEHEWDGLTCIYCGDTRENPFTDVPEDSFYSLPVLWAVDEGITNGASATTFNPGGDLLRAQVVTFLWRAAGSPKPVTAENPFVDVPEDEYYRDAVLWAYENGITAGIDATHFGPSQPCTREQVVTFLWVSKGRPETTATVSFSDVPAGAYYYNAVSWAAENGITSGIGGGIFGVGSTCTRSQVVTFLYAAK